jgi:REP element-mobilizing transposase RayT
MSGVTILRRSRSALSRASTVAFVPRPRRSEFQAGLYHVVTRGAGGIAIFGDDDDRFLFLHLFARTLRRMEWSCHAYCLMTNHYHLLVQTKTANLSAGMHVLNGTYARAFNERHGRRGHLFGARFYSGEIDDDDGYERSCLYVVENAVRAGMCAVWTDWPWCGLQVVSSPPAGAGADASRARHRIWPVRIRSAAG